MTAALAPPLGEYYDAESLPSDALGRAARKLDARAALYLGAGVGAEKQADKYVVTRNGGEARSFGGPLSATTHAFALAGRATDEDSPGGSTSIASASVAARVRELEQRMHELESSIASYRATIAQRGNETPIVPRPDYAERGLERARRDLRQVRVERARLLRSIEPVREDAPVAITVGDVVRESKRDLRLGRRGEVLDEDVDPDGAFVYTVRWEDGRVSERVRQFSLRCVAGAALSEEVGKPGTNWTQVNAGARRKIAPIVKHYMSRPHPFTECVRDNTKRFGEERAKRVCAVVKDLGRRTTKWRGKDSKVAEEIEEMLGEARERLATIEEAFGETWVAQLIEGDYDDTGLPLVEREGLRALSEGIFNDRALLFLAGEGPSPIGEAFGSSAPARDARRAVKARGGSIPRRQQPSGGGSGTFDESKHKRAAAGTTTGGQFVSTGSSGTLTKAVQRRVGARVDGEFGELTKRAVMDFQRRHGLVVDGKVGRQTALALAGRVQRAKEVGVGALRASDRRLLRGLPARAPRPSDRDRKTRAGGGWLV